MGVAARLLIVVIAALLSTGCAVDNCCCTGAPTTACRPNVDEPEGLPFELFRLKNDDDDEEIQVVPGSPTYASVQQCDDTTAASCDHQGPQANVTPGNFWEYDFLRQPTRGVRIAIKTSKYPRRTSTLVTAGGAWITSAELTYPKDNWKPANGGSYTVDLKIYTLRGLYAHYPAFVINGSANAW